MNFPLAFAQTLLWRPDRALAALYWHLTGRKVRARNKLRLAAAQSPYAYATWIETTEQLGRLKQEAIGVIGHWNYRPLLTCIVYLDPSVSPTTQESTIRSIRDQFYSNWQMLLVRHRTEMAPPLDDNRISYASTSASNAAEALNIGTSEATGDYILPLQTGDQLSPAALFHYVQALQDSHRPVVLYGDEDRLNKRGHRINPWFKPEWNEEMFLAQDYVSASCAIEAIAARRAALSIDQSDHKVAVYALLLKLIAGQSLDVCHIPHILCHRGIRAKEDMQSDRVNVVAKHVKSAGTKALPGPFGSVHVAWPLPADPPLVSIIIPTRDKVKLLQKCVDGVLSSTNYPNLELVIVDNGSVEASTHRYLSTVSSDPRVRILPYAAPYNYSAINNHAATHAQGQYLCLLNNDTEIISDTWLTEMMRQAVRPHVGAVGAKLLYGDGSIQHAGVIIGLGEAAGHAHRFLRKNQPGYFNQAHIPQYVSAVTAACLVVEKRKFNTVGGLDADHLAIAFNDVDLCLKLEAAGWKNVYAPQAVLIHHESKSRGKDISPQHIQRYLGELAVLQDRWGTKTFADPLHNPNLNRAYESFHIQL